ncbi:hypothetical protein PUN28_010094 [Cardiocondyla obscurior]|uniref:Uncharacterized protein n=1 Tax=Cardiocondyla obscurior TaxID=286306 RepID=A0AAW2FS29_9HYME
MPRTEICFLFSSPCSIAVLFIHMYTHMRVCTHIHTHTSRSIYDVYIYKMPIILYKPLLHTRIRIHILSYSFFLFFFHFVPTYLAVISLIFASHFMYLYKHEMIFAQTSVSTICK